MVIGFVACCGRKLDHPAMARDLYRSDLFRKSRAFAEANCDAWYIVSALHGIVSPEDVIAPYDVTLSKMSAAKRRDWASRTLPQVTAIAAERRIVLAGKNYRSAFEGITHEAPMAGMGIGQQLAWLSQAIVQAGGLPGKTEVAESA